MTNKEKLTDLFFWGLACCFMLAGLAVLGEVML